MNYLIKLLILLAALTHLPAFAMGLGQEVIYSTLGEKLFIELPIMGITDSDRDQLRFSIADIERYTTMGVDFDNDHRLFKFSVVSDNNGHLMLLVTSENPIKEPFLNFIIDMNSPKGQLFKEVSVLLDTPH